MQRIEHKNADGSIVKVWIGEQVAICENVIIGRDTTIGDRVTIRPGVVIGDNVKIGEDATISSFARLGQNVSIGARAFIGWGIWILDDETIEAGDVVCDNVDG